MPLTEQKKFKQFDKIHLRIAQQLINSNINQPLIKKVVDLHNDYYRDVQSDLQDLANLVSRNLQKSDAQARRKEAIARMKNDSELMEEIKEYVIDLDDIDDKSPFVRLGYNKTPLILSQAIQRLESDEYFNDLILSKIPVRFSWNDVTLMGGVKDQDYKGSVEISALAASLFYLLDETDLRSVLGNKSSVIYGESITEILKDNPKLLQKVRQNYHLFSDQKTDVANPGFFEEFLGKAVCEKASVLDIRALEQTDLTQKLPEKTDLLFRAYEAYEFGGDKDLENIRNSKHLPLDCSTGIARLLDIKKGQFSTYHLASYYNEFFKENSVYWQASDWPIREEIIKSLKPVRFAGFKELKPGEIVAWRNLKEEKSLKNPGGYVGNSGHIGIVIGQKDEEVYYFSWMRNLEDENKSGLGIDVINIADFNKKLSGNKIAVFVFVRH